MKSLDTLLAEAVGKMKPATRKKYNEQTRRDDGVRISQESLVNIAEALLAEDGPLDYGRPARIKRNNGASSYAESDPLAEADRIIEEAIGRRDPAYAKAASVSESALASLSESQRKEYEFCLMLRMSESDALKVAKAS